jgi:hypothetical protein
MSSVLRRTLSAFAVFAVAGCGVANATNSDRNTRQSSPQTAGVAAVSPVPKGTFVSLVPACACARHTELDLFSASSGRRLGKLAVVSPGSDQLGTPAAASDGRLFFTFSSGPRCIPGSYAECPQFVPDSCRDNVEVLSPGQTGLRSLFTVIGSQAIIGSVVPRPDGKAVALTLTPCLGLHGTTGLFVRDLRTRAMRGIATSSNRCDGFGPAAWSPNGQELVFPLERARGRPIVMAGGIGCPGGRSYLALTHASRRSALTLIDPDHGCIFRAAAFDKPGIAAVEGCNQGDPEHGVGSYLGHAYLLQYNRRGQMTTRIALHLGLEQAVAATEPSTDSVLITQDQPANEPYPERDWVWEFDGQHLRAIARYKANDAAQILAIPW